MNKISKSESFRFLSDIGTLSMTAIGGPAVHISMVLDLLVLKRKYLEEEELLELMALCAMLPGPTSTQTITAIGYKKGGPILAFLTLLVWAIPAILFMSFGAYFYQRFQDEKLLEAALQFLPAMGTAFICFATYKIGEKVIIDRFSGILFVFSGISAIFIKNPFFIPILIAFCGTVGIIFYKKSNQKESIPIPTTKGKGFLYLWILLLIGSPFLPGYAGAIFNNFYQFGSLIFGGGQVLIPMMQQSSVIEHAYLDQSAFMTGYGLVQSLPGPLFSFSAWVGGFAFREGHFFFGAFLASFALFLPGTLLLFGIFPFWKTLRSRAWFLPALKGLNAGAGGLLLAAGWAFLSTTATEPIGIGIIIISLAFLFYNKIPAAFLPVFMLIAGLLYA